MRLREKLALSIAPIILRIMLGVAFLWLGLGRLVDKVPIAGDEAAVLVEMGAMETPPAVSIDPAQPTPAGAPAPIPEAEPVRARRLYQDAVTIYQAANPRPGDSGDRPPSTWPRALAGGNAPVVLAWIGTTVALVGGSMLLIGLLTRLWAVVLMVLMVMIAWLTQMGPAIQSGNTRMGVLPDRSLLNPADGQELLWQFVLLMSALTLMLAGSGAWALDRAIFGKPGGGGGKHG